MVTVTGQGSAMIGTSNVVMPGNKSTFPEPYRLTSRLHYYGTLFNSVEVNSSFYKTPLASTYKKWAAETPEDFKFTIKLSKEITHTKNLESDLSAINRFMQAAAGLGTKKGCVLIQFPGKVTLDFFSKVENILRAANDANDNHKWCLAAEFRHPSWYIAETTEMLHSFRATMVYHDHPKAKLSPTNFNGDFIYLRFHGPEGDYRGSYSDLFLQQQAALVKEWLKEGKDLFIYFNNTIGNAFGNARTLARLVK